MTGNRLHSFGRKRFDEVFPINQTLEEKKSIKNFKELSKHSFRMTSQKSLIFCSYIFLDISRDLCIQSEED
jgi:hypothetical protein